MRGCARGTRRELLVALLLAQLLGSSRLAWSSALPRVVLHVGPHKTASSYVQSAVCKHEDHLRQNGWVLPLCAKCGQEQCGQKSFAPLAWQLADGARRWGCATDAVSCFRESLQEAREAGRHVFVSAEGLSYLEQDRIQHLAELLQGFDVSIVIFVRDALPRLMSMYAQTQKGSSRNQTESLASYFLMRAATQQGTHSTAMLNGGYGALLARWAAAFGESALHLVSYEGVKAASLDPFLVILDKVMRLPVISNHTGAAWINTQPPSRVVAATSFLVQFIQARSDLPSVMEFHCAKRFAEQQLLSLLPITCRPFADWTAAFNERERAAAASVAPGAHRHYFEHQPEESALPEVCEVAYPQLYSQWRELMPKIRRIMAHTMVGCRKPLVRKPARM